MRLQMHTAITLSYTNTLFKLALAYFTFFEAHLYAIWIVAYSKLAD